MTSRRSLLVSWILGAAVVGLVTFSFEALSARETAPERCPVTGATAATGTPRPAVCPAQPTATRCPATGATATPAAPSGCPAGGKALESTRAGSVV